MKSIFVLLILIFQCYCLSVHAQVSNDTLDNINLGSTSLSSMQGMYGVWGISSGHGNYSSYGDTWLGTSTSGTRVSSIFRKYQFKPNTNYKLVIGINYFGNGYPGTNSYQSFTVLLANNVSGTISLDNPSTLPTFSSQRVLYTYYDNVMPLNSLLNKTLTLMFTTGPSESFDNIVFYPLGYQEVGLDLNSIGIYSCPVTLTNITYSTGSIPSGTTNANNIYVGSSYGSSSTLTSSNPDATTYLRALQTIITAPKTVYAVNGDNTVILEAGESCSSSFSYLPDGSVSSQLGNAQTIMMKSNTFGYKNEIIIQDVSVVPNPTTGKFTVEFDHMINGAKFDIYSIDGRKVKTGNLYESKNIIDISDCSNGIYYLKLHYENHVITKKMVKE